MVTNTGTFPKQIYFNAQNKMEVGVVLDAAMPNELIDNKKIVLAGTPIKFNLENRATAATAATETDVQGILVHDVDITDGKANGTACIFGFINLDRLEAKAKAKLTPAIKGLLKANITFLSDN